MKVLPNEKYKKISELAKNGDDKAKDFLFTFMEKKDDEVNEYLSTINVEKSNIEKAVETLIADENEAIEGYDKAIMLLANSVEYESVIKVLQKIKEEEINHIKDLKGIEL